MKHVINLFMKFILFFVILYVVQSVINGSSVNSVLTISISLTILSYLIGDLWILPSMGNTVATLVDFILAFIGIWVIGNTWISPFYPWASIALTSAVIIAVGEWFFHKYIVRRVVYRFKQ